MSAHYLPSPDPAPIITELSATVRIHLDVLEVLEGVARNYLAKYALWLVVRSSEDPKYEIHFQRFVYFGENLVLTSYVCADGGREIEIAVNPDYLPVSDLSLEYDLM